MILSSASDAIGRRINSLIERPRAGLWRAVSTVGHRCQMCSADSSASPHSRHSVDSDRLTRACQRRSWVWWPLRKRMRSERSCLDRVLSSVSLIDIIYSWRSRGWIGGGMPFSRRIIALRASTSGAVVGCSANNPDFASASVRSLPGALQ